MAHSCVLAGMCAYYVKYAGADPGFLERGFIYIKVCVGWGFALLILSHFAA